jgi:hypothetical protein
MTTSDERHPAHSDSAAARAAGLAHGRQDIPRDAALPRLRALLGAGSHLHRELKCKPWEQAVEDPDAGNPEPAGTYNYEHWRPDEGARARWRALEEALGSKEDSVGIEAAMT